MKKTTGGFRAAQFETILAADRGEYADKFLYSVEGLPGVWRRAKAPKMNPENVGLLACWFDGGIIYLEHCASVNEEIEHTQYQEALEDELAGFLERLKANREDAMMRERADKGDSEPAAAATGQENGPETAQPSPATVNGSPSGGEVEV